jgi:hypothetical protein
MSNVVDLSAAAKKIALADHILTQTYPLTQEPKLLISVCQYLDDAGQALVAVKKLTPEQRESVDTLRNIVQKHKDAPIEFKRKQNFVICEDDYKFSVINKETVARHLRVLRTAV